MGRSELRKDWENPTLTYIGHIAEVVQQGGGKLSTVAGDPGETERKPPGGE